MAGKTVGNGGAAIVRFIIMSTRPSLGGISSYGEKRRLGESEILKIPPILKILILTKTRNRP